MGRLRSAINNSGLGWRINHSRASRWFQQTDFALSVEEAGIDVYGNRSGKVEDKFERGCKLVFGTLFFPVPILVNYAAFKLTRLINRPNYDKFRKDINRKSIVRAYG